VSGGRNVYAVVAGCGQLGSFVANSLSASDVRVMVMDHRQEALDALNAEFSGFRMVADASEFASLRSARLDKARVFVATTGSDNLNIMLSQAGLRVFRVQRVVARVADYRKELLCRELGIETVSPATITAHRILRSITGGGP
jgi:trk system potassium uptake protein TrkA